MKKVLQLSNYYYPEVGGIEKIAQSISNAIKDDCEVKVVCFTHKKDDRTDEVDGVQITRFGTKLFIASQQLSFSIMGNLKTIIADYNPDIIIIHMPNPFLCWLLLRYVKPGQKVIVYWHSGIVKQKVGNAIFKPLITKLLERSEKIFCTSPNYIDGSEYLSRYRKKCVVVPNCIEEDSLQLDSEAEEKIKEIKEQFPDKIICVGIGRQVPYKGFEYIVQAMKLLDDRFELFLLGRKGESTDKIVQLSQGMKNIHMVGEVSDIERKAYLAACDIFCFRLFHQAVVKRRDEYLGKALGCAFIAVSIYLLGFSFINSAYSARSVYSFWWILAGMVVAVNTNELDIIQPYES